jgi:tetratricopeptide (TPR) repeat protein
VASWLTGVPRQKVASIAVAALLLITLGCVSWRQSGNFRDYETLFRATLAGNPRSAFVHNNLGVILMSTGREAEAAGEFESAVRLAPESADYRVNQGLALSHLPGRMTEAIATYQTALRIDPGFPAAHLNLGLAYTSMAGRLPDAIEEYRKAIAAYQTAVRSEPDLWQAHFNLGLAYGQMPGHEEAAIAEYRTALRMKPESALAHFHLGNTFHKMGHLPDAISEYQAALSIDPDSPETHYELAYALAQIPGRVAEAIEECRKMLALKPGDEPGRQLMASLLAFQDSRRRPE